MFRPESENQSLHDKQADLEIAQSAAEFVKYVLPFGADNRGELGDRFSKHTPDDIHRKHQKLTKDLQSEKHPDALLEKELFLAKAAIKHGAGNCELQSAVAFVFLLSQGVTNIQRVIVDRHVFKGNVRKRDPHAFLEFKTSSSSSHKTVIDPWDDNAIYTYDEMDKDQKKHTGIRQGIIGNVPKITALSETEKTRMQSDDYKKFLKETITQTKALSDDEKFIAFKLLQIPLKELLEDYINNRSSEWNPGMFSKRAKISSCEKVINLLNKKEVSFTKEEYEALLEGRLGRIISIYSDHLPSDFFSGVTKLEKKNSI